jgi:hypothetical protein
VLRVLVASALLVAGPVAGPVARAQDASARAAYRALTQTPPGALLPPAGASITGVASRWNLYARYSLMSLDDDEYVHYAGIGGDVRFGAGRIGLTLGAYQPACSEGGCPGHFMGALTFSERIVGAELGRDGSRATLNVGLDAAAGLGTPPGGSLWAGSVSLPISFVPDTVGFRVVPYLSPGIGTGLERINGQTDAGIRGTLGAGAAVVGLPGGLAASAGVQRVFLTGGNWLVGLSLSYGPR